MEEMETLYDMLNILREDEYYLLKELNDLEEEFDCMDETTDVEDTVSLERECRRVENALHKVQTQIAIIEDQLEGLKDE